MDPSLSLLEQFQDASLWEIRKGVAVFDEHDEHDARRFIQDAQGNDIPNPLYMECMASYHAAELHQIAENCNRRERETGDACPITIGHTRIGRPETEQPETVGFARHFRVGRFGPAQKLAVLADFWLRKEQYPALLNEAGQFKYPRRSVELWPGDLVIDPIALIIRRPKRDLGVLLNSAESQPEPGDWRAVDGKVRYTFDDEPETYDMPEIVPGSGVLTGKPPVHPTPHTEHAVSYTMGMRPSAAAAHMAYMEEVGHYVMEHHVLQHPAIKKLMGEVPQHGDPVGEHVPGMTGDNPGSGTGQEHAPRPPIQHAGAPSGSNTFTPSGGHLQPSTAFRSGGHMMPDTIKHQLPDEALRMQYEQQQIQYAAMQSEMQNLRQQNEYLMQMHRRAQREKDLIQLEAEHYQFDRAEELAAIENLPQEQYAAYLSRFRKNCRRAPISNGHMLYTASPTGGSEGAPVQFTREMKERAIQMASESGGKITYDEAMAKVRGAK